MHTYIERRCCFHVDAGMAAGGQRAMFKLSTSETFAEQLVKVLGVAEDHVAALVEVETLGGSVCARGTACGGWASGVVLMKSTRVVASNANQKPQHIIARLAIIVSRILEAEKCCALDCVFHRFFSRFRRTRLRCRIDEQPAHLVVTLQARCSSHARGTGANNQHVHHVVVVGRAHGHGSTCRGKCFIVEENSLDRSWHMPKMQQLRLMLP